MPTFMSESELRKYMEVKMRTVLENATSEILDEFKKYIELHVYKSHGRNKIYNHKRDFREAWEWSNIKLITNTLVTELAMNPSKMEFDPYAFEPNPAGVGIHGSYKYQGWPRDFRESMDIVLNKRFSSSLFVSVYRPIGYWDEFIKDYVGKKKIVDIIKKHALAQGLTVL